MCVFTHHPKARNMIHCHILGPVIKIPEKRCNEESTGRRDDAILISSWSSSVLFLPGLHEKI